MILYNFPLYSDRRTAGLFLRRIVANPAKHPPNRLTKQTSSHPLIQTNPNAVEKLI